MPSQTPIGSGFGAFTTAEDIVAGRDLRDIVAIVTGGYSGIGLETTRVLRQAGADVIVPARDLDRAATALAGIAGVEIAEMDLMNPVSIDAFANWFLASDRPLNLLINSAGIMAAPLHRDVRGYESHFAVNHLGHFQLAARLWPSLRQAGGARVISVSSWGHRHSPVVFEDPNFEHREYDPTLAYGQSKTANILFAVALDERGKDLGIRAFSLHPGAIVDTNLKRYLSDETLKKMGVIDENGEPIIAPERNLKTVAQGAATSVWCATSSQLDGIGGVYCENCDISPLIHQVGGDSNVSVGRTESSAFGVMPYAVDPKAARRLWELSEQLVFG